eukprot:scaffold46509_cov54-Attheya_sp.AAC.1
MGVETFSGEPSSRLLQKSETSRSTIWGSSIICSLCNECKSTKSFNKEEAKKRDEHRICNACGPPLPKDLNVLTIDQLKSKLRERKSDLSGKKSDLVVRLQALVHKEQWLDEFLDDNDKGQKSSTSKASPNLQQTQTHASGVNSTETSTLTHELILSLKVADLKKELKGRGLPVSGLKTDLQKRLAEANGCFATSANKNASKSAGRPSTHSETKKKRPELKFDWTHTALYIGMVGVIKFFFPWLITYCATRTFATSLFSLWMPFLQTVNLIHRYRGQHFRQLASEQGVEEKEDAAASQESSPIISTGMKAGTECDDPMDTWDDISLETSSTSEPSKSSTKSEAEAQKLSSVSLPNTDEIDASTEDLKEEALDLLKYWVVYTILCALSQVIYLTPILGRLFSKYYQTPTKAVGSTSYFRRFRGTAPKRFTSCFMSEMQLIFYIWLYFLPLNLGAGEKSVNNDQGGSNKTNTSNKQKSSTIPETSMDTFSNRPLDLVYDRFSEYAVSLHDSTNMLAARAETEADTAGMLQSAVSRFKSGLDLAVLVRFMSNETKESIISILSSSVALLPAAITLMMPGHLTEFGVVYVKAVVPAAKSSHVCRTANESDKDSPDGLTSAIRFLEYWIIYSVLSGIIAILAPFLAWVPLSTHFIFLVWSYAQLENPLHRWYETFEKELISFGLMQPHDMHNNDCSQLDISETVTVRILKKMGDILPNGLTSPRPKSKITHGTETSEEETIIVNADEMEVEVQLDLPPLLRKASSEESEAAPGQSTTERIK